MHGVVAIIAGVVQLPLPITAHALLIGGCWAMPGQLLGTPRYASCSPRLPGSGA